MEFLCGKEQYYVGFSLSLLLDFLSLSVLQIHCPVLQYCIAGHFDVEHISNIFMVGLRPPKLQTLDPVNFCSLLH